MVHLSNYNEWLTPCQRLIALDPYHDIPDLRDQQRVRLQYLYSVPEIRLQNGKVHRVFGRLRRFDSHSDRQPDLLGYSNGKHRFSLRSAEGRRLDLRAHRAANRFNSRMGILKARPRILSRGVPLSTSW